ncbi:phage holin family protein [Neisseria montereyensis]|uniref:Phage holin family protein n=1 Tax=Neisseria montereyensis TaxID=2973938 RepID=A0ABT2FDE7_9NEIS|nr:phage holin family protein [Neisseria montereyensis]MCS4533538.1 phage holin family protein [Neisseria montereyensis]
MSLKQKFSHMQILLNQGADLLVLRLRMLQIDLSEQAATIVKIFASVVFMGALFVLSMISLLLGLNYVLDDQAKIWVFFGITVVCLLIIIFMVSWAVSSWKQRNAQVVATLRDIQEDLAYLSGKTQESKAQQKMGEKDGE